MLPRKNSTIKIQDCQGYCGYTDCEYWDICDEDIESCMHEQSVWKEMSYRKYTMTILDFNYSEYSDGEQ